MSSDIRAWLNGARPWAAGVQLYQKHGTDAALIHTLQQGETPTAKKALFYALKGLLQPTSIPQAQDGSQRVSDVETHKVPQAPAAVVKNPASIEAKKEADLLYQQMCNERAQLLAICPVEESPADRDPVLKKQRGRLAKSIMRLQQEVDDAYDDYRYALKHGVRREKAPPVADDVDALMLPQAISNLRKNISKWKAKEQTAQVQLTIAEKEALLTQYIAQYEQAKASGPRQA